MSGIKYLLDTNFILGLLKSTPEVLSMIIDLDVLAEECAYSAVTSGLSVRNEANEDGDIAIEITQLRPGEKLYEELLIGDNPLPTAHPRIMKAHEEFLPSSELAPRLQVLTDALQVNNVPDIRALLKELVPGYQPDGEVVDWVHLAQAAQMTLGFTKNQGLIDQFLKLVAKQIVPLPYKHWHTAIAGAHGLRVKLQPAAPACKRW